MATNSLSAITYWCQGKTNCTFDPRWILGSSSELVDAGKKEGQNSIFYLFNQGSKVRGFLHGTQVCGEFGGHLARLDSLADTEKVLDLFSAFNSSSLDGFWIEPSTKDHFKDLQIGIADGNQEDTCLVLIPDSVLRLKWESCYQFGANYGALCEVQFGGGHKLDNSCFNQLQEPILEYRIHLSADLNRRDVNCPMKVDSRRGNTCYKLTSQPSDWNTARAECWSFGGELAFPLPRSSDECAAPIYGLSDDEVINILF